MFLFGTNDSKGAVEITFRSSKMAVNQWAMLNNMKEQFVQLFWSLTLFSAFKVSV